MKRKVSRIGPSTLMVSLPNRWVKANGVRKGDEIDVIENGKELIINSQKEIGLGQVTLDVTADNFSRRLIYSSYTKGYDTIRINFKDKNCLNRIYESPLLMIGFEIIQQSDHHCVLKNIAAGVEEEFDVLYGRLINIVLYLGTELYKIISTGEYQRLNECLIMEDQANKLNLFCKRMLNIRGYKESRRTNSKYHIICLLEEITDQYRNIARYIAGFYDTKIKGNIKWKKPLLNFFKKINEQTEHSIKMSEEYPAKELDVFRRKHLALEKEAITLMEIGSKHDRIAVLFLLNIAYCVRNITGEIY